MRVVTKFKINKNKSIYLVFAANYFLLNVFAYDFDFLLQLKRKKLILWNNNLGNSLTERSHKNI